VARPKKDPEEKKDKRLTLYFTQAEFEQLNIISESIASDKTKIITKALNNYLKALENPPPALKQASYEQIMSREKEQVNGYICSQGHPFWLEWAWPSEPVCCPCCGAKEIKNAWSGLVRKGF